RGDPSECGHPAPLRQRARGNAPARLARSAFQCCSRAAGTLVPLLEPDDPPINTGFIAERANSVLSPAATRVRDAIRVAARDWR
ncbi:hypothetical protein, partial [Asanoa sp. NPDC050611]|uniref:hypothetical protein n=1 Tax=Asanoa sp. NPDC050611 TaxID=3157098 RepID=UPI0033D47034